MYLKQLTIGAAAIAVVATLYAGGNLFETNNSGYYMVKQAAVTGEMTVHKEPGVFSQNFGDVHTYRISDVYDFNGQGEEIKVRFNDAATADISGSIKFRLSLKDDDIIRLHTDFRSYDAVVHTLVRQVVAASLKQTATFFGAEEVYSTRRSEFIELVNNQIRDGIYSTTFSEQIAADEDGNNFIKRAVNIRLGEDMKPVIAEPSAFQQYGIEVIQIVINNIEFDQKTNELIAKRKEAEQEKVVAKANAERAKQDAITATEKGRAEVARAEAEALVVKKTAVINAEKEKEVAVQAALQAIEEKKRILAIGEAEAESARLKVSAGLTPLEKATIDKETAIGVAEKLAQVQFPQMMVIGGGDKGGPLNPFDAVGLESFLKISKGLAGHKE